MKRSREEEGEAQQQKTEESVHDLCARAKLLCGKIRELQDLSDISAVPLVSTLRKCIRDIHLGLHKSSEISQLKSDALDALFIEKQNLLYQKLHIAKAIEPLLRIKSKADDIPLIPLEEYQQTGKLLSMCNGFKIFL
jgi:hypothetical protein